MPFLPLLVGAGGSRAPATCNFSTTVGMGNHWLVTLNIRFGFSTTSQVLDDPVAPRGNPSSVVPIIFPNNGQGFSSKAYNANRSVAINPPPGTKRVGVAAIISGHGNVFPHSTVDVAVLPSYARSVAFGNSLSST